MKRDAIDFEKDKVSTLFRRLLIPTFLGTVAISAVTAIDGIFIGHGCGPEGVAAVNIVLPIYQIMAGIGLMAGVGCSVVASIHMSKHNIKGAKLNATQAIIITTLFATLLCVTGVAFPHTTAGILGSSETLMPLVVDYLKWIMPAFIFQMWTMIGLFIIRLDGSPKYAMWCNIIPAALNAVLDWLFIFPLGMGVKGAAIATMISIAAGGFMALSYLLFFAYKLKLIRFKFSRKSLHLSLRNIGYQCKIGTSTLFGELTLAVLVYVGNIVFMRYLGDAGVGAFGIACYYTPFFFMMGNAIAQSAQPIISYNYGAERWNEIRQARTLLLSTSLIIGFCVAMLFIFCPKELVALFVDIDSEAGRIATAGFPYYAAGIVFFILNIAVTGYYQSVELIRKANLIVLLRGCLFLIPSFMILPDLLGVDGIWLSMPCSEILTSLVIMAMFIYTRIKDTRATLA